MADSEQIGRMPGCCRRGKYETYVKKLLSRRRRREDKKLLDDAPKKNRYRGWTT